LTALTQPSPEALGQEIARMRSMCQQPFGVNLTVLPTINPPPYEAYVDAIIANGIAIVETAGNRAVDYWPKLKAAGIKIIHKCVAVRHALTSQRLGADIVSIDGFECAGHPGEEDVPGLVLIPLAARALKIPVVASGGIADGYGMAAALVLGAEGVNMGTRFEVTQEAPIHENIKQALAAASERDTRLIFRTLKNTSRVFGNEIANEVLAMEGKGSRFEDIRHLVAGSRGRAALEAGNIDGGIVSAGLVVGLIDDVPDCHTLIQRMVRQCWERVGALQASFAAPAR